MKVDIISRQLIKPSSPTPPELRDFKLSLFDERIPPIYVPLIFYYSPHKTDTIKQSEMSNRLKESLSHVLTQFYPLAGKMKGNILVDCDDEGAYYVEARVDAKLSHIIDCCETKLLDQFLPYDFHSESVKEQLAIQVSLLKCGGIVIGICISHRIGDGCTLCTFIKAWAEMASGPRNLVRPIFNSASLFPPRNSPDFRPNFSNPAIQPIAQKVFTKRFVFTASAIAALKAKMVHLNSTNILKPTRVEAVSALLWQCCIAAAGLKKDTKSVAFHPVNLRRKVPELPDNSFGNIFQMASAVTCSDQTDLGTLVGKLRAAIEKIDENYVRKLQGENGPEISMKNLKEIAKQMSQGDVQVLRFSSWCGFPVYEADFGWGKPNWVSGASFANIDSIMLVDSRCAGGIEAWVVLAEQNMAKLEQDVELQAFTTSSS